ALPRRPPAVCTRSAFVPPPTRAAGRYHPPEKPAPVPLLRSGVSPAPRSTSGVSRSEEHTSELQSLAYLVCRLLLEKKKKTNGGIPTPASEMRVLTRFVLSSPRVSTVWVPPSGGDW